MTDSYQPDPRRWKALAVTLVAGFMSLLDISIVSVALPSIQHGLGTGPAGVQWVVSGYALTFGLALVPAGRLGDALGRRTVFLAALGGFVLFSALAGLAPTTGVLVAARLAQGVCAGALAPQNSALIQQLFRGPERGRAFGFFGATVAVSTAIGPVVGGLILAVAGEDEGWRWIFYVNVPIGLAALVLAARLLPRGRTGPRGELDPVGVALLGAGVLAVMLPLVLAESGGLRALWWLFAAGAVLLAVFVRWERGLAARDRGPLLDIRLFTSTPGYGAGAALGMVYFIGFSGIWLVFALYFQVGLGYTPLQSGLAVTPFAAGSAVTALLGGRLVERWGRKLTVTGLSLVVVGLAATAVVLRLVPGSAAGWAIAPALLVAGVGGGWVISPNTTLTLRHVPVAVAGAAGGALQTGQRIGAAVGTAALPGVFYAVLSAHDRQYPVAASIAIGAAAASVVLALAVAVVELRVRPKCPAAAGGVVRHFSEAG
ncbi:EmrB/QacA subfamily drug resistance transporter [Saccharothrix coeruleofusca]|uniref:MFS transporter n=1 Tax=Saccharothrix coeruleofusca TaxID=33919 RepID=UPI001AE5AA41|nr:MFS transporter [Saccharothrix coeruleofusca]MBP2336190.1 EmrB/QacA subfamily drug resistance transporter [Saccharothrix coeruleofusca]